ncbi:hypothetical protein KPATCC21470_4869 [Kitasatospora purpeofusca]
MVGRSGKSASPTSHSGGSAGFTDGDLGGGGESGACVL